MNIVSRLTALLAGACVVGACEKDPEIQLKEVPKTTSWRETGGLSGMQKVILNVASNGTSLYLTHPAFFTRLEPTKIPFQRTTTAAGLPYDVSVRLPVSSRFFTSVARDTLLGVASPSAPLNQQWLNLRRLDRSLVRVEQNFLSMFTCMALSQQDVLLLSYANSRPGRPYTLLLAGLSARPGARPDTLFTRKATIPRAAGNGYVRQIRAMNDYFLVQIAGEGLFRITPDGAYTKVLPSQTIDAIYPWQGKVYAFGEWDASWVSDDQGRTWRQFGGVPAQMVLASYCQVGDSLVGSYRDHLFTVHWQQEQYRLHFLKNDGLQNTQINGLAHIGDSVYVGTTSGLFARSLRDFFQTRVAE